MSGTPEIDSVADMARVWGSLTPDKVALIDAHGAVTYGELDDRSNRIANAIIDVGVRPGSHIGYLGKNSAAFSRSGWASTRRDAHCAR